MMKVWILIFYIDGYNAGGPAVAEFVNKSACERAIVTAKEYWGKRFDGICIEDKP